MPPPSRDSAALAPTSRGSRYFSWASSTCSLPSRVRARRAKMSRIELRAIDHLAGDQILQLAQLRRRQLVVDDDDVDRGLGAGQRQRLRLAAADEGGRVGGGALLQRAYDGGGAGGVRQPFELVEGLFGVDPAHVAGDEPDESRALERGEPTFAHDVPAILHAYNRTPAAAAAHYRQDAVPDIPIDFVLFALTLIGVALFHHHTLRVAVTGLIVIAAYKVLASPFREGAGLAGLAAHLAHEWVVIANLFLLLTGFALLARHFEDSGVPESLPRVLPGGIAGAFALLAVTFVLSSFLDNIAAALIGATMAKIVFPARPHRLPGGDRRRLQRRRLGQRRRRHHHDDDVDRRRVAGRTSLHAYVAAVPALLVGGWIASRQQHAHAPMRPAPAEAHPVDWGRLGVVAALLLAALAANIGVNATAPELANRFPVLGVALWAAILATAAYRRPDWSVLPAAITGSIFLLSLVLAASMMPVERLPPASWMAALGLGFVSAVFDNIPLTALALRQGGYDWGMLAYAVGFGGSMIWFGSSAGVAVTNVFPEAKSVGRWLRHGWHVALAYVIGFAVLLGTLGWQPHPPRRRHGAAPAAVHD